MATSRSPSKLATKNKLLKTLSEPKNNQANIERQGVEEKKNSGFKIRGVYEIQSRAQQCRSV